MEGKYSALLQELIIEKLIPTNEVLEKYGIEIKTFEDYAKARIPVSLLKYCTFEEISILINRYLVVEYVFYRERLFEKGLTRGR